MKLKDGIHNQIGQFINLDKDTLITPFFTAEYCDYLIEKFNKHGWEVDQNGNYDTYLHKIEEGKSDCRDFLNVVKEKIEPKIVENWTHVIKNRLWKYYPVPFGKKFSKKGQEDLKLHVDNSLITLFVKLNDDYQGCDTVFPRQNWDTSYLKKGDMLVIPGVITHPHYTTSLESGEKYSLIGRISILDVRESDYFSDDIERILNITEDFK